MADHKLTEKITKRGKEQITKVDNSRTEEKMVTAKPEAEKAEAPKKKKNIIRVYHAQNASDGGKNRTKRPVQEKKPGARPQAPKTPRNAETVSKKPENQVRKPAETKAAETSVQKSAEAPKRQADNQNRNSQRPADGNQGRLQNRQPREQRDGARDNGRGRDFRGGDRRTDNRNQGDRRPSDNRGQGRPARNNEGRPFRNDGEGRPARNNQGDRRPDNRNQGDRRPSDNRGQGRPDGNNRFGGGRSGQRPGAGRRNDSDASIYSGTDKNFQRQQEENETEKIKTRKKILINLRAADTDQTRAEEEICPDCRRLFRSRHRSQSRKKRNLRLRRSHFLRR